jgi:hypothetical protein
MNRAGMKKDARRRKRKRFSNFMTFRGSKIENLF